MSSFCFDTSTLVGLNLCWKITVIITSGLLYFAERKYFVEVVSLLDKQIQEMKLMTNAIRRLEGNWVLLFNILAWHERQLLLWIFCCGFHLWLANRVCLFVRKTCVYIIGERVIYNPLRVQRGGSLVTKSFDKFYLCF